MKSKNVLFLLSLMIILSGCSDKSVDSSVAETNMSQNTATEELIESNEDGSLKVFQLSSSSVAYDGEHGLGGRGHHIDYLTTTLYVRADGVINSVSNTHKASSPKSRSYQLRFDAAIEGQIVGKKISDATVGIVGGASTTSEAFKAALDQIRTQFTQI